MNTRDISNQPVDAELADYDPMQNHALVIGINAYAQDWSPLRCAVADAKAVKRALSGACGFPREQVELLLDGAATRKGIADALERSLDLGETENLVVFFGGHGWFDKHNRGYWIPQDARRDNPSGTYISNSQLVGDYLTRIKVRHLLVISDCCFGGSILRGGTAVREEEWKVRSSYRKPSRWVLTSGDLTPVPDDAGTGGSPFTTRLVQYLEHGDEECFGVLDIHAYLRKTMLSPEPMADHLATPSHMPGGEFIFRRANLDAEIARKQEQLQKLTAEVSQAEERRRTKADAMDVLDAQIAEAEQKLETVLAPRAGRTNLDDLLASAQNQVRKRVDSVKLEEERRTAARRRFEEDYVKYRQILELDVDDELKRRAWQHICREWNVEEPPDEPSILIWRDDAGVLCPVGRSCTIPDLGVELLWVPPGAFQMGSMLNEDEQPVHDVTLTRGFWMGKYPVTQEQYEMVMGDNPSKFKGPNLPVESVSWDEAREFLSIVPGARLPSEAEWEYACRAGTATEFCYGSSLGSTMANFNGAHPYGARQMGRYRRTTTPVGRFNPNLWDLYDMHGNVWEWCSDWYGAYPAAPSSDPQGPPNGTRRVVRGGSWMSDGNHCRSAYRGSCEPTDPDEEGKTGFRVVVSL